nr:hypothetical protein [Actinomycetota bacterium]
HCCTSPAAAARYAGEVWAQWGKRAADVPEPYLVYGGWTGLFYPSHLDAPPYIVMPLARGGGGRRWPSWRVATARMEEIIVSGAAAASAGPAPAERGPSDELPGKAWPAAVVLLAAGGIALLVRRTRRVGVEA